MQLVALTFAFSPAKIPTSNAEHIPPGTHALALIHDENMNGKLDTNWLEIPKEGYYFSNDVKAVRGAPSFSDASFPYDGAVPEFHTQLALLSRCTKKDRGLHERRFLKVARL